MNARCCFQMTVTAFSVLLLLNLSIAGDLRDRRLPSEKALERTITNPPVDGRRSSSAVPQSVYDNFRKDVIGLTPDKKKELEKLLRERIAKARAAGDDERATYNLTLLGILKEN